MLKFKCTVSAAGILILFAPLMNAQSVRDSAGARIVTHSASAKPQRMWTVAPQPVVEIGGADGIGPTLFATIWDAARSDKGLIVVTEEPTQELRVFDAAGRHLRTFGRKGAGPGEFSQVRRIQIYGDTVYALDNRRGAGVFTIDGKLVRQRPYPSLSTYHAIDPWGALADGSIIEGAAPSESRELLNQVGTRIQMRGLFRIASDARSAKMLREIPTYEYFRAASDPPGGDLVAFSPTMSVAVMSDRICTARGSQFEIRCMNAAGEHKLIIRRAVAPIPVSADARNALLKKIRTPQRTPNHETVPQERLDQIAANTHFASTFPAFDRILPGPDGEVWVSEYKYQKRTRPAGEQAPVNDVTRWNVFAKDGAWIGAVDLATRLSPTQFGKDFVLGVNLDDDGVARVSQYRLTR